MNIGLSLGWIFPASPGWWRGGAGWPTGPADDQWSEFGLTFCNIMNNWALILKSDYKYILYNWWNLINCYKCLLFHSKLLGKLLGYSKLDHLLEMFHSKLLVSFFELSKPVHLLEMFTVPFVPYRRNKHAKQSLYLCFPFNRRKFSISCLSVATVRLHGDEKGVKDPSEWSFHKQLWYTLAYM